jgi:hydroxymethylpyrimidine pyrophosphatase-like HAD family hydrolase
VTPIRLLAADLDGTLLDPTGVVSPRTLGALAAAQERSVRIVLATARRYTGALPIARAAPGVDALIVYDGAQLRAYPSGDVLFAQHLPAMLGQQVAELMAAHGVQPIAQHGTAAGERLLVGPRPPRGPWADAYLATTADQVERVPLAELCAGRPGPLRLVAFAPLRRLRRIASELAARYPIGERLSTEGLIATQVLPRGNYGTAELTVFAPGVSKGAALIRVAEMLHVPLAQTLAIGDGLNDISMLRIAGLAVAMGTAPRALRRVAQVVTGTNAEDGVAQTIERHILGRAVELAGHAAGSRHGVTGEDVPSAREA